MHAAPPLNGRRASSSCLAVAGRLGARSPLTVPAPAALPWLRGVALDLPPYQLVGAPNEERLYLDRAWFDSGLHPEPSIGEYLPEGMHKTLEKAHRVMKLPPFKPDRKGKARPVPKIIRLRWQNGRQEGLVYKRIMLDETYKSALPPKMAAATLHETSCRIPRTTRGCNPIHIGEVTRDHDLAQSPVNRGSLLLPRGRELKKYWLGELKKYCLGGASRPRNLKKYCLAPKILFS